MAAKEVTNFSLECFHKCLEEGKPIKALGCLLIVTNLDGSLKNELCSVLLSLIGDLSERLAADGRYDDLMKCYEEVLGVYADDKVVLDSIGSHLFRFKHLRESRRYFQLAHSIDGDYLPAWKNLQNVTNALLERWHFRMLNDCRRNDAFRKAILRTVGKGAKTVIDIGTGTGLLSLYCKIAGAHYVCACDVSSVMTSIASQVFDANLSPNSVKVVNKLSTDMAIPEDLPYRCSLVVTETMDSGLLGEHMLHTMDDAWDRLLLPPDENTTRVIPSNATLFAAPIESSKIAKKNRIRSNYGHKLPFRVKPVKTEPYDTENLVTTPCRFLADPVKMFNFNFNDPREIKRWLNSEVHESVQVPIKTSGRLDAVAVWFEAQLDDELTITTSPLSPQRCSAWHHAVFPCDTYNVNENTELKMDFSCTRGVIDVVVDTKYANDSPIFVDSSVISFLNDLPYLTSLETAFEKSRQRGVTICRVIDMSLYPHLGLFLSKKYNCQLLAVNDIPEDAFTSLLEDWDGDQALVTHKALVDVGNVQETDYDMLIVNFVESTGEISEVLLRAAEEITQSCLIPGALIFPGKIEIWAQLVECPQLVNENKVNNRVIDCEFDLSKYINEYTVSTHLDLCTSEFDTRALSKPFLVGGIPTTSLFQHKGNIALELTTICTANANGDLHAVVYWFKLLLYDDVIFTTLDSHVNQVAEMIPSQVKVKVDDAMFIRCVYSYGVVKLTVEKI